MATYKKRKDMGRRIPTPPPSRTIKPKRPDTSSTMETFTQTEKRLKLEKIDGGMSYKDLGYKKDTYRIISRPEFPKDRNVGGNYPSVFLKVKWNTILILLGGAFIIYLVISL